MNRLINWFSWIDHLYDLIIKDMNLCKGFHYSQIENRVINKHLQHNIKLSPLNTNSFGPGRK